MNLVFNAVHYFSARSARDVSITMGFIIYFINIMNNLRYKVFVLSKRKKVDICSLKVFAQVGKV